MTRICQSLVLVSLLGSCRVAPASPASEVTQPIPNPASHPPEVDTEHTLRPVTNHIGPIEFCWRKYPREATKIICVDRNVTSIEELANFMELRELDLGDTSVVDLSPLASCTKLERLSIRGTEVRSVEVLAQLPSLHELDARHVNAPDTEFSALTQLHTLDVTVSGNSLDHLESLDLHELAVSSDNVTDISGLSGKSFHYLELSLSQIRDISPLATIRAEEVVIDAPLLTDVSPLFQIEDLEDLKLTTGSLIKPPVGCKHAGVEDVNVTIHGTLSKNVVAKLSKCAKYFDYHEE